MEFQRCVSFLVDSSCKRITCVSQKYFIRYLMVEALAGLIVKFFYHGCKYLMTHFSPINAFGKVMA